MPRWQTLLKIFGVTTIILCAVFLSLFQHWEPSLETWGYWVFTRIVIETQRFIVLDRSPLYTLYLIPFRLFQYPTSVYLESLLTTSITLAILAIYLKKIIGLPLAVISSLAWLPFIQISEPPVHKLALVSTLLAVIIRETFKTRSAIV